jgi:Uma2 family endonuclease
MHASVRTMDIELPDIAPQQLRRISGNEFDQMCRIGLFQDEHVELLRGVLVTISPQNEPHARVTAWLGRQLGRILDVDAFEVRQHSTFAPLADSRPEPDVAVFRQELRAKLPTEALLLIEVSDSSLRIDRKIKLPLYAEAGVPEYWIVDINAAVVEVYTEPTPTGYARAAVYRAGDMLQPIALAGVHIAVGEIPCSPGS